ncbi:YXWGXW repeat-containing protein [Chitinophaga sp. Hz27]|uniref:YXWGXW repeat-containing protein n=1 Tax=Chitinophaga sp. Hz27 TaxID=3347169 RepID=UPI0035D83EF2
MRRILVTSFIIAALSLGINEVNAQVSVGVGVSIHVGPPALPIYTQPMCPGDGFIWTPGYWAYGPDGYFWVPGVWVRPPRPRLLWTPGYWGFVGGVYAWHAGYWGPHIGFYGGINYGFGYGGVGFEGGMWQGNVYHYNTACANVNTTIVHNTYVRNVTVINNNTTINNRTSYNGEGGVTSRPNRNEEMAMREERVAPTTTQQSHENTAMQQRAQPLNNNREMATSNNLHNRETSVQGNRMAPGANNGNGVNNVANNAERNNEPQRDINRPQHNDMRAQARPENNNEGRMQQRPQQAMRMPHNGGGQAMHAARVNEARAHHERMHRG